MYGQWFNEEMQPARSITTQDAIDGIAQYFARQGARADVADSSYSGYYRSQRARAAGLWLHDTPDKLWSRARELHGPVPKILYDVMAFTRENSRAALTTMHYPSTQMRSQCTAMATRANLIGATLWRVTYSFITRYELLTPTITRITADAIYKLDPCSVTPSDDDYRAEYFVITGTNTTPLRVDTRQLGGMTTQAISASLPDLYALQNITRRVEQWAVTDYQPVPMLGAAMARDALALAGAEQPYGLARELAAYVGAPTRTGRDKTLTSIREEIQARYPTIDLTGPYEERVNTWLRRRTRHVYPDDVYEDVAAYRGVPVEDVVARHRAAYADRDLRMFETDAPWLTDQMIEIQKVPSYLGTRQGPAEALSRDKVIVTYLHLDCPAEDLPQESK